MESNTCKGCIHLRQYNTTKKYFCAFSTRAKVQSVKGKSMWPFRIEKPSDVSCDSYEKEQSDE